MMSLLDNLNPEQLAAVTLPNQSALILAGAGSGKTRVLTTRIAWLIQTGNVSPGGVLAVTFTNKAAKEMLTRISAMLPINVRGMWVGTFHGLCNRLLRAHHRDAGLPQQFQILDSQDQLAAVKRVLRALNVDEDRFPARDAQYFINGAKEEGKRANAVEIHDELSRRYAEIYAAYDEQCQREGAVDFAELLLRTYELLSRNEILREHYQHRFRHILVDEFQDTNRLQYRWLKLLAGRLDGSAPGRGAENVVFAVGDDDQSIYAFRGANVGNMAEFERDFHVDNVIRLEQNYRSHGHILAAANALISHNRKRLGKNLWTSAGQGEPVRVHEAQTDGYEAAWITDEVQSLKRDGLRLADMAVLYRSNAQSRILEHALFSNGIPYRVYGGLRFFERLEIKHALAYLRLVSNPDDDGAFLRVSNFPTRGIGARTLEQLQDAAKAAGVSLVRAAAQLSGKAGAALGAFVGLIESMRAETQGLPLQETVEVMLQRSGLVAHYKSERDGADRVENLLELVNAAAAFVQDENLAEALGAEAPPAAEAESGAPVDPLASFLAHAALESGQNQAAEGADALQLMTVHSAKGLEFHAVFITGLEEGLFPHEQSITENDGLEEERRLMYVAITRARTRLYLSFAQTRLLHGQTRYNVASRFIDEIPQDAIKWLTPRFGGAKLDDVAWAPEPKQKAAPRTPDHGFRIGQAVVHPKFGQGVIVSAEGSGTDARLQINFGRQGMKWLALEYAKLQPA
ncbi:MAG: UvrD-helicase domain-containing protein [Burkholderiales bacterium]